MPLHKLDDLVGRYGKPRIVAHGPRNPEGPLRVTSARLALMHGRENVIMAYPTSPMRFRLRFGLHAAVGMYEWDLDFTCVPSDQD